MKINDATHLTDSELITEIGRLGGVERAATVALIAHLAEFDARRLFEGLGFSSTFKYCMVELRLSEDAAFNRIEAARAARRYPLVLEMLESGALSPTTARMIARRLTPENHEQVLAAASGRSKQDVELLLAGVFPQPDVRSSIRPLRSASGTGAIGAASATANDVAQASTEEGLVQLSDSAAALPTAVPVQTPNAATRSGPAVTLPIAGSKPNVRYRSAAGSTRSGTGDLFASTTEMRTAPSLATTSAVTAGS